MKIVFYGIVGAIIGLVAGYFCFAWFNGNLISPSDVFAKLEGLAALFEPMLKGIRDKIMMSGLAGGAVGAIIGAVSSKRPTGHPTVSS